MAECSELAMNMTQIATNIASQEGINDLDDVVKEMQKYFPDIRRASLVEFIIQATSQNNKEVDETIKKVRRIMREPFTDRSLRKRIKELEDYLNKGIVPKGTKKDTLDASTAIQMLREMRDELKKKLQNSPKRYKERLEKSIAALDERIRTGDILPKTKTKPRPDTKEIRYLLYKQNEKRRQIRQEIKRLQKKPLSKYLGAGWDLFRMFMPTGEFSFAMRQGGIAMASHPVVWTRAVKKSFAAFFSAKSADHYANEVFERENAPLYARDKLRLIKEGQSLSTTEESIMNYWFVEQDLPGFRNFNRAATAFFNQLRADLYDIGYKTLSRSDEMTAEEGAIWANWINVSTGSGNLGSLENATLLLNRAFFSARYTSSRFAVIAGSPIWAKEFGKPNLQARTLVAQEYVRLGIGLSAIYTAMMTMFALMNPPEDDDKKMLDQWKEMVELSPYSSDFLKIRVGRRRLDLLMGMQQPFVFLSRMIGNKTKNAAGVYKPLSGEDHKFGTRNLEDVLVQFSRSKLSPQFGVIYDMLTRQDYFGRPLTSKRFLQLAYPMTWGDIADVMKQDGLPTNIAFSVLAMMGAGMQVYDSDPEYEKKQVEHHTKNLLSASNTLKEAGDSIKTLQYLEAPIPDNIWSLKDGTPQRVDAIYQKKRELDKKETLTEAEAARLKRYTSGLRKITKYSKGLSGEYKTSSTKNIKAILDSLEKL